jgi:predicted acylesterase/phospholipase RssA
MINKKRTKYFQNCLGVFQGGGCKGIAYVGAFAESVERGVSFSEIVGVSAGSIIAVFIAAGATPEQLQEIVLSLEFKSILKPAKHLEYVKKSVFLNLIGKILFGKPKQYLTIIKFLGLFNSEEIENFIDINLRKILNLTQPVLFKDLIIPCSIVSSDLKSRTTKIWSTSETPNDPVGFAVRASCNIPFFFQPVERKYVDGGMLSNLPTFLFKKKSSLFDKIIAFSFKDNAEVVEINNINNFIEAVIDTSILGSIDIQVSLMDNVNILPIETGSIKTTDFHLITPGIINELIQNGRKSAADFFENETSKINITVSKNEILKDIWDTYKILANTANERVEEILIFDTNTEFVYDLFPTIVKWKLLGAKIRVLLKNNTDDPTHGPYRFRFLQNICNEVKLHNEIPFRGLIINGEDNSSAKLISINQNSNRENSYFSKYYFGESDFPQINLTRNHCFTLFSNTNLSNKIEFKQSKSEESIFQKLKNVNQYSNKNISFEIIEANIEDLIFITKYVRGYRFRQINYLIEIYKQNNIELFKPLEIFYSSGKSALVTPPVVEKHGSTLFVIEGNTRLKFLHSTRIKKVYVIKVEQVEEELPSSGRYKVNEILISDVEKTGSDRYNQFSYDKFRKIEKAVRNPKDSLK